MGREGSDEFRGRAVGGAGGKVERRTRTSEGERHDGRSLAVSDACLPAGGRPPRTCVGEIFIPVTIETSNDFGESLSTYSLA